MFETCVSIRCRLKVCTKIEMCSKIIYSADHQTLSRPSHLEKHGLRPNIDLLELPSPFVLSSSTRPMFGRRTTNFLVSAPSLSGLAEVNRARAVKPYDSTSLDAVGKFPPLTIHAWSPARCFSTQKQSRSLVVLREEIILLSGIPSSTPTTIAPPMLSSPMKASVSLEQHRSAGFMENLCLGRVCCRLQNAPFRVL